MKKHAYLIIAHKNENQLKLLLKALDYEKHDIFLHIDRKNKDININNFRYLLEKSNLYIIERKNCAWGGSSMIKVVLELLKQATTHRYEYYHLLSGEDFPLAESNSIFDYFNQKEEKYIYIGIGDWPQEKINERVKYHYIFQNIIGNKRPNKINRILRLIQDFVISIEKKYNIESSRVKGIVLKKGVNWFSIPYDFAIYVVKKEEYINKLFKYSFCGDEVFMQTILEGSPYKTRRYGYVYSYLKEHDQALRLIDWKRGAPYTFTIEDKNELESAYPKCLFVRKVDYELARYLYNFML